MSCLFSALGRVGLAAGSVLAVPLVHAQVSQDAGANLPTIVVTAQHLNEERARIDTQTGASTYTFSAQDIEGAPGGENRQLNQVMLQVPDAAQDSFGQLHIRGDHNGLQFRLNGVILPDSIAVFGQTLPPRLVAQFKLITGSLPAEYGLRSAGIIDLTTKGGALHPGGELALYGGSHGSLQPSFNYGGSTSTDTYFITGDYLVNALGIESPDGSSTPLHDHTRQHHGFGYYEHLLDEGNRLTVIAGTSDDHFQIPNRRGVHAADIGPGLTVNGISDFLSDELDENQRELTHFAAVSLQHSSGPLSTQSSLIARYSSLNFTPDPQLGDLLFNGISQFAYKRDVAYGLQSDAAYTVNEAHTVRAGVYFQTDRLSSETTSQVLSLDPLSGLPLSDVPSAIADDSSATQWIESAYAQDEWHLSSSLVLNYGLRFDHFSAFASGSQLSPRANLVWQLGQTTLHAGYSRFFSPPPFELVGSTTVNKFLNTTAAPAVTRDDPVLAEKSNYYDFGVQQQLEPRLAVGFDSYFKQATNLVDEGQFGAPIILTPFNYRHGQVYGFELTGNYTAPHLQLYANVATQKAIGKEFISSQFNFSPADLAYVATHYIDLDHEQRYTGSAGFSYSHVQTRISGDALFGSGLRNSPDGIPNGGHLPYYRQVNLGVSQDFGTDARHGLTLRFDVINVFDQKYEIRDGTGVGVGAPQFGPRRGFFGGLTWRF
ncbi:MAG: TonB-dependent receptor [Gammaproteobacteria bacterium]|nr:TonB-dependent receptor [Gammaproteobacteria bacterium]